MRRVTSLLLVFVLATGSLSAFIPDRSCVHECCEQEMDCCVGNSEMENCSITDGTDISSPNLIASGPKPSKCRQDAVHQISDLVTVPERREESVSLLASRPGNPKVPLYSRHSSLLI